MEELTIVNIQPIATVYHKAMTVVYRWGRTCKQWVLMSRTIDNQGHIIREHLETSEHSYRILDRAEELINAELSIYPNLIKKQHVKYYNEIH